MSIYKTGDIYMVNYGDGVYFINVVLDVQPDDSYSDYDIQCIYCSEPRQTAIGSYNVALGEDDIHYLLKGSTIEEVKNNHPELFI